MIGVLIETLVWTGVLIAAVLVLRRPVARHFGPEAAYALWLLPAARLVLPPVTLPAWMQPAAEAPVVPDVTDGLAALPGEALIPPAAAAAALPVPDPAPLLAPPEAVAPAGFDLFAVIADLPLGEVLLAVWLGGAVVVLCRRFAAYFALRAALLAEGRAVGRAPGLFGRVRLIETPATAAPLAMGVCDPVIALPPGFMALHDRAARDLALAHELAHHRGGDLLVNVIVQPLFALHWWNPLGRYGWLALRRDQEAACDSRVMAHRSAQERAAYAALIARFAGAPGPVGHAALTAPMACPVLGEKSIIHRLRSLAMSDLSPRRRLAGRALLGAGLLALPLTASIGFAADETAIAAPQPPLPPLPPMPPEPPEPPLPPEAPTAPDAPDAPLAPIIERIDPDLPGADEASEAADHAFRRPEAIANRMRMVFHPGPDRLIAARRLVDPAMADSAEWQAMLAEIKAALAETEELRAYLPELLAEAKAARLAAVAAPRVVVRHACRPGSTEVTETESRDGVQVVTICEARVFASARQGLEEARAEIARDKDIPEDTRKQVLRTLDRQIERWSGTDG
jgi:beta-lactamase regulating signal transducer with metallopeptidase domain